MITIIKGIFSDILFLYKNFFHRNISKILIHILSFVLGILLSIPFFISIFIVFLNSSLDWKSLYHGLVSDTSSIKIELLTNFLEKPFTLVIVFILLVFAVLAIFFGILYGKVLLANLNLNYLNGKKLAFFKNSYFNFKLIFKFFKISLWQFLILIIPILFFIACFYGLYFIFGGYENILEFLNKFPSNLGFSILLLILFITCTVSFIYIFYRILFSYIIFLDESSDKKALKCIEKSIKKTKGFKNIFRFSSILVILIIILLPFDILNAVFENNKQKIKDYISYSDIDIQKEDEEYYYEGLKLEFNDYSKEKLQKLYTKNLYFSIVFYVLYFLFINGLIDMFLVSFYKRQILANGKKSSLN